MPLVLAGTTATPRTAGQAAARPFVERTEIWSKNPGGLVGMPFVFLDVDGDHNLDVVTFWDNELVGYFGDGAFGFRREVLLESRRGACTMGRDHRAR